jgi:hypothetical protein
VCRVGPLMLLVQVQPEELSVRLGSYPRGGAGDQAVEAPGTGGTYSVSASARAVTRVKPEQAPKGLTGAPSRRKPGEGRRGRSVQPTRGLPAFRGIGHSTCAHIDGQHGRPARAPRDNGVIGHCRGQESEEVVVPRKPGNSGGGKDLWFEVRSDEKRVGRLA